MNFVHIVGRLARDPETRVTSGGLKVTSFVVATNSYRQGNEETIWWRVTLWGDRFDKMIQYFTKGKPIMVGGELRKPELYTDKNGQPQIGSLEITGEYIKFVPFGKSDNEGGQNNQQQFGQSGDEQEQEEESESLEEEPLPF